MSFPSLTAKQWQSIVPKFSLILTYISLNLCNNIDQHYFQYIYVCQVPRKMFKPSVSVFNISLGTWQTLIHGKLCLIPILKTMAAKQLTKLYFVFTMIFDQNDTRKVKSHLKLSRCCDWGIIKCVSLYNNVWYHCERKCSAFNACKAFVSGMHKVMRRESELSKQPHDSMSLIILHVYVLFSEKNVLYFQVLYTEILRQ